MTKSLSYLGFVAGFWNGLCGEVDKSKPPVGGLVLERLLSSPQDEWVGNLLLPQFLMWNRWWAHARQFSVGGAGSSGGKNSSAGLLAPGSTRENMELPIACISQSPEGASRCETGLDNSPLCVSEKIESSPGCTPCITGWVLLQVRRRELRRGGGRHRLGGRRHVQPLRARLRGARARRAACGPWRPRVRAGGAR
jgi:hypothetical protein